MDKSIILFLAGLGIGIFVGQLELPSDLATMDSSFGVGIVAATEIWLIIHYIVALTTLVTLQVKFNINPMIFVLLNSIGYCC